MRLDDLRSTENVDDQRGAFGGYGPHVAVGGGGLGIVAIVVVSMLLGVDPSQLLSGSTGAGTPAQTTQGGTAPRSDDAAYQFARKIVGSAEDVWTPIMKARGIAFSPATLTVYDNATQTGCGEGLSSAGPFYCPSEHHIYLDLSFFNQLADQFGAPGQFAQAYVIAHEYGHHIQNLVGTMDKEHAQLQGSGATGSNGASVRIELQADCYAGVWAFHANQQFSILQQGDVDGGLRAASSVGDDALQKQGQGYVVPDSFTHGTSEQRVRWFKRGLAHGDMDECDTFSTGAL